MNNRFNYHVALKEMGLQAVGPSENVNVFPYGATIRDGVTYMDNYVRNQDGTKWYYLLSVHYLFTGKNHYFLIDVDGNVTKLNGGRIGSLWVEDAQRRLKVHS